MQELNQWIFQLYQWRLQQKEGYGSPTPLTWRRFTGRHGEAQHHLDYSKKSVKLKKQVEAGAEELGLDIEKYLDATGFWETPMSQKAVEFVVCHSIIFCPYFGADCFIPMQQ